MALFQPDDQLLRMRGQRRLRLRRHECDALARLQHDPGADQCELFEQPINANAETGYNFQWGGFDATPEVGLQYLSMDTGSFSETGNLGAAQLNGLSQYTNSLWASAGSRFSFCGDFRGMNCQLSLQARYLHDMCADNAAELMQFQGGASPFMVLGTLDRAKFRLDRRGVSVNTDLSASASTTRTSPRTSRSPAWAWPSTPGDPLVNSSRFVYDRKVRPCPAPLEMGS